ncbi:MAG: RNA 2',3'-cyclic phosphodiesterase [Gaiellaceae bacterium]
MEGREHARLFLGLPLPADAVAALVPWQERELRGGRVVEPPNLHVTLAFLGSTPVERVPAIAGELAAAAGAAEVPVLTVSAYRETRSVGMLVLADLEERATRLAADVHARLERLGVYERDRRGWLPHLTVLRFRQPPRLRPALPDLGEVSPSEAAVYLSRLRSSGAQYDILESVEVGGS